MHNHTHKYTHARTSEGGRGERGEGVHTQPPRRVKRKEEEEDEALRLQHFGIGGERDVTHPAERREGRRAYRSLLRFAAATTIRKSDGRRTGSPFESRDDHRSRRRRKVEWC